MSEAHNKEAAVGVNAANLGLVETVLAADVTGNVWGA